MWRPLGIVALLPALAGTPCWAEMRVAATLEFPHAADVAAVDPVARRAFLLAQGHMTVVDLDTLESATYRAPLPAPHYALVDSSGGRLYFAAWNDGEGGSIYVVNTWATRAEYQANVAEGAIFGGYVWDVAGDFARNELYVGQGRSVYVLDMTTLQRVASIPVPYEVAAVAVDRPRGRLLAGRSRIGDGEVALIDVAKRTVVSRPYVYDDGLFWDHGPTWPVVDERGGTFFLEHASGELSVVDSARGDVVGGSPRWGYTFGSGAFSTAWSRYYRLSVGHLVNGWPPVLESIESGTGKVQLGVVPVDAHTSSSTLLVDDDGGDLFVSTGAPATLYRLNPDSFAQRESLPLGPPASAAFRDPVTGRLFLAGWGRVVVVESQGAKAGTRLATSFHHTAFDHHFVTADAIEQRLLDDGRFGPDWKTAPDVFRVWSVPSANAQPVCRFFSAKFAPKSSHFYTPYAAECEALKQGGDWQYEGIVFHVALPDASGACPAGTEALYRLYNNGRGGAPNHRYTPSTATRDAAEREGWVVEGAGTERVFACTPALR